MRKCVRYEGRALVACLPTVQDQADRFSATFKDRDRLLNPPLPHLMTYHCLKGTFLVASRRMQSQNRRRVQMAERFLNLTSPGMLCFRHVSSVFNQAGWFDKWKWLDWDNKKDCVYCHPCRMAVRLNFTLLKKAESAFSESGFRNWKDAVRCFKKHEASHSHRDASLKWLHYTKSQSVASQLSNRVRSDQAMARNCLLKLITTLCFLAHQGLAFRGHNESQGNFMQLLQLRSQDCPELSMWIKRRDNWLSHEVQYELLEIMAHSVLDSVLTMLSLLMKPRT